MAPTKSDGPVPPDVIARQPKPVRPTIHKCSTCSVVHDAIANWVFHRRWRGCPRRHSSRVSEEEGPAAPLCQEACLPSEMLYAGNVQHVQDGAAKVRFRSLHMVSGGGVAI